MVNKCAGTESELNASIINRPYFPDDASRSRNRASPRITSYEAMELYFDKLSADGMLVFHISNRYLNLEPLLSGLSRRAGLTSFIRRDKDNEGVPGKYRSIWVVVGRNESALGSIPADSRWQKTQGDIVWTDDFSNILSLLK